MCFNKYVYTYNIYNTQSLSELAVVLYIFGFIATAYSESKVAFVLSLIDSGYMMLLSMVSIELWKNVYLG